MINGQIDIDGGAAAGMMDTCGARAGEAAAEEIKESMGVGRPGRRQTGAESSERIRARICVSVCAFVRHTHTCICVYILYLFRVSLLYVCVRMHLLACRTFFSPNHGCAPPEGTTAPPRAVLRRREIAEGPELPCDPRAYGEVGRALRSAALAKVGGCRRLGASERPKPDEGD